MKKQYVTGAVAILAMAASFVCTAADAWADLRVNVMPSGVASPINSWDSEPYTWPGNNLTLWGNVQYTGTGTLTYTWNFGAGEGSTAGTVSNRNNIAATHAYGSSGSYVATLTVTDGTESDTDTVYIDVVPQSLDVRANLSIQRALKYLYLNSSATTAYDGSPALNWNTYGTAGTGLAVLAFEDHGHREMNDPDQDIYAETVEKGLNYILSFMYGMSAVMDNTTFTDSDVNGNGRKVYCEGNNMYYQGIVAMALANTATPDKVIDTEGSPEVRYKTYKTVLTDMVDFIAFAQQEGTSGYAGGWRYSSNYGSSDNSVSQWPVLGLAAASGAPFNIAAPAWVRTRLPYWINYSQNANGGFGYTVYYEWVNIAKTGSGIIAMKYAGSGGNLTNAVNYINNNWGTTTYDYGNIGDHYAMYAVKKGMQYAGLSTVGAHDWQQEYNQWYVNNQYAAGHWPGSVRIGAGNLTAAFGLLVMAPGLVELPPVADAGIDQEVPPGQPVTFDGTGSTHTDPARSIVSYQWDFNYDGITFDVDGSGAVTTNAAGYAITNGSDTQNYTVALRVTDDSSPALSSTDTAIVKVTNGNTAPVADPGGPYSGTVGSDIVLDASGSYDDNSADGTNPIVNAATASGYDEIVSYQWDLDGDNLYGTADEPDEPEGVSPTVNFGLFMGTKTIGLKVTDSFGRSAAQSSNVTTAALSDLYPVSYQLVSSVYNRLTAKWTVTWKVNIHNAGDGSAYNVSAQLTDTSIPAGVTVLDGSVSWTDPDVEIASDETQLSGNVNPTFSYTYPRTISGPDLTQITWDIELTDELGTRHIIRNIPQ